MPFGLTTALLVFTKMLLVVISFLRRRGIDIYIYFHDSLLHFSEVKFSQKTRMVLSLLMEFVLSPSREKSDLVPSQDFVFLGYWFRTDLGLVLPPLDKFLRAKALAEEIIQAQSFTVRWLLKFLRFINILADVLPLWRLHIIPL